MYGHAAMSTVGVDMEEEASTDRRELLGSKERDHIRLGSRGGIALDCRGGTSFRASSPLRLVCRPEKRKDQDELHGNRPGRWHGRIVRYSRFSGMGKAHGGINALMRIGLIENWLRWWGIGRRERRFACAS